MGTKALADARDGAKCGAHTHQVVMICEDCTSYLLHSSWVHHVLTEWTKQPDRDHAVLSKQQRMLLHMLRASLLLYCTSDMYA